MTEEPDASRGGIELPGESLSERIDQQTERFVHAVELVAAGIFALLFAIGVVDLAMQIGASILSGEISDPRVVISFVDTGLLLLIVVEVYQTVVAHIRQSETHRIVRLVIFTGIIAMVRKVIVFRVSDYGTADTALYAAVAYAIVILALAVLLFVERFSRDI